MDKSDGDESNQSSPKSPQLKQQQQPQPTQQPQQQQQQHKRRIKVSSNSNPSEIDAIDSELVTNSLGLVEQAAKSSDDAVVVIKKRVFIMSHTHTAWLDKGLHYTNNLDSIIIIKLNRLRQVVFVSVTCF